MVDEPDSLTLRILSRMDSIQGDLADMKPRLTSMDRVERRLELVEPG